MNNVLVVMNFDAGRKKAVKYKKRVLDFLIKRVNSFKFVDIDEFKTTDLTEFDTIIAMGGDGTVNKIVPFIVNTDKILGIIPCGTANLLAAKLGISYNLNKTLQIIEQNNVKNIDLMSINDNLSALRLGIGYDADIICKTPQSLKHRFGYFAYFIAGILFALRLKNKEYSLLIDKKKLNVNASCIIIANAANMYRNIISLADNSILNDGYIEGFVLKTTNPIIFFKEFLKIAFNIRKCGKYADYFQAKSIQIDNKWAYCHIDGEKKNFKENIQIDVTPESVKMFTA